MTREQLEEVGGIAIGPPSDDIALAIADALLPAPLPPALRAFLSICDGAQAGEVEVFDTERIIAATNAGRHAWQLPSDTLVIGAAGAGRALIMTGGRDESTRSTTTRGTPAPWRWPQTPRWSCSCVIAGCRCASAIRGLSCPLSVRRSTKSGPASPVTSMRCSTRASPPA